MRWLASVLQRITWLHIERTAGLAGLFYEIIVDKVDKPSVCVVLGAMILGGEGLSALTRIGDKKDRD